MENGGQPIVVSRPDSENAQTFVRMAERIRDKLAATQGSEQRQAPKIVMR